MSEFSNVTVVREANVYFNGGVTSRTVIFPDGTKKTLGIMLPGEYTFNTGVAEIMEILSGQLDLKLPGKDLWDRIGGGESFEVPANSAFTMRVLSITDYCCSFLA
ncbi:MAG: pyrimidine/purine nucleoside phosphorylase [Desulfuromonadales bacterium]|nr:MAG: pyrimidine/purine nucleoside phosphorylase [Desulfuromonadales bacterium]